MKASFRLILAALAATVALTACTKEITPNFENDKVNLEGSRVIAVSFAPQTKTTLDGFQPKFEDGKDTVLISNTNALDTCVVSVKDNKATISTDLTGPLTAVYPYKAAKMNENNENEIDTVLVSTEQSGKFSDANICMAKMKDEKDESLSFENKTAVFCIHPPTGNPGYVKVKAEGFSIANNSAIANSSTICVATTTADSVYASILVPDGLKVSDLSFSAGTSVKAITTGDTADKEIAAGTLYTVTKGGWESTAADIPEGALEGVFTVSDNDTPNDPTDDIKVRFSQGNLVATIDVSGAPTAWKFATNQYDYLGVGGANRTIGSATGDIDLFGWSTDASSNNWGIHTKKKSATDITTGDFKDWGKAYCGQEGLTDGTWQTLSTAEWQYLFGTSKERNGKYNYAVTVCNKENCIILLPDNWQWDENTVGTDWQEGGYSETTDVSWSAMEEAGAVCLPAAGYRDGTYVYAVDAWGFYWSSSSNFTTDAWRLGFSTEGVGSGGLGSRYYGYSVRLVTNVSAAPAPTEPTSEYVEIAADYDNDPNTANTTLKWYRQNLAITDSGKKAWNGGNASAVKVPGTNGEEVIVGDYFQWAASYGGYNVTENQRLDFLLIYTAFTNKGCGESEDKFTFIGSKQFNQANAPYSSGSAYTKYNDSDKDQHSILDTLSSANDDVAHLILGENWRMPTSAEFEAMKNATYWAWDATDQGYYVFKPGQGTQGAVGGRADIADTDNKAAALLFFPAAGRGNGTDLYNAGDSGIYWSSSLYPDNTDLALRLSFSSCNVYPQSRYNRCDGFSVRPVSE